MNPQVEYFHTTMEMQNVDGQHKQPNVVEDFKYPHDMDRGSYPF